MADLTYDVAHQILKYEPETGKLFWLERLREFFPDDRSWKTWNANYAGREALTNAGNRGYMQGTVLGRAYKAHRIIWLLQTGSWPTGDIDHINGDKVDNRWINLRDVSSSDNMRNAAMRRNNTSGVTGVVWSKRRSLWEARIKMGGRRKHLGYFDTIEAAEAARVKANADYGFTARHGIRSGPSEQPQT